MGLANVIFMQLLENLKGPCTRARGVEFSPALLVEVQNHRLKSRGSPLPPNHGGVGRLRESTRTRSLGSTRLGARTPGFTGRSFLLLFYFFWLWPSSWSEIESLSDWDHGRDSRHEVDSGIYISSLLAGRQIHLNRPRVLPSSPPSSRVLTCIYDRESRSSEPFALTSCIGSGGIRFLGSAPRDCSLSSSWVVLAPSLLGGIVVGISISCLIESTTTSALTT